MTRPKNFFFGKGLGKGGKGTRLKEPRRRGDSAAGSVASLFAAPREKEPYPGIVRGVSFHAVAFKGLPVYPGFFDEYYPISDALNLYQTIRSALISGAAPFIGAAPIFGVRRFCLYFLYVWENIG